MSVDELIANLELFDDDLGDKPVIFRVGGEDSFVAIKVERKDNRVEVLLMPG